MCTARTCERLAGARLFVTGGTGFVGGHVVRALHEAGAHLRCLVRRSSRSEDLARLGVERVVGSLEDPESLRRGCEGCDGVVHLAGRTKACRPEAFLRVNARGTAHMVDAAVRAGCRFFLYMSSLAAAGPSSAQRPRTEKDPPHPVSAYGRSKLLGEEHLAWAPLRWVILRPPGVYGPGDRDLYVFFKAVSWGILPQVGCFDRSLSLIFVGDLARAVVLALRAPQCRTYFVSNDRPYRWREIVAAMERAVGRKTATIPVPFDLIRLLAVVNDRVGAFVGKASLLTRDKLAELAQCHWTCSAELARRELGFQSRYDLLSGFRETARWYRAQGWLR